MANIMTKRGSYDNVITYEHYCDSRADMANIDPEYITLGSICVVITDNDGVEFFIAKSDHTWHPF